MSGRPTILVIGAALAAEALELAVQAGMSVEFLHPYPAEPVLIEAIQSIRPAAIVVRTGTVTAAAIRAAMPDLRLIAKHGVGVDTIDVAAATACGVPVSITTGANALSVAEHALALILAVARGIPKLDSRIRAGHWDKTTASGIELSGKTLGLVGFGAIARLLADLTAPFQMPVIVYDPHATLELPSDRFSRAASLRYLLEHSDVVSLHCPLTSETRHMISAEQLGFLGARSILINTARGGLIDEAALADALEAGRLAGAALDTFSAEPLLADSPLLRAPNLVLTPHVGASTDEAKVRVGTTVMHQAIEAVEGRLPADWMLANPAVRNAA